MSLPILKLRRGTCFPSLLEPRKKSEHALVGALVREQSDEWQVGRRYMSRRSLHRVRGAAARQTGLPGGEEHKVA
ncbi:MAG: hypothetical protein ACOCYG_08675 [Spirochaetota bacterium]